MHSFTDPRENIINYSPWILQQADSNQQFAVIGGKRQGKSVIAQLENISDRDTAAKFCNWQIFITRKQMPTTDDFYWADLVGLEVHSQSGATLGVVDHLIETGANDVLVVKGEGGEHLIPFLLVQIVKNIDLAKQTMTVDWQWDI